MAIDRDQVQRPTLPKEAVPCEPLGGEVIVRGMLLAERLQVSSMRAERSKPLEGESAADAGARASAELVPKVLAFTVLASDLKPLFDEQEWQAFGCTRPAAAMLLFNTAMRLSGHDAEHARKNS